MRNSAATLNTKGPATADDQGVCNLFRHDGTTTLAAEGGFILLKVAGANSAVE